MDVLQSRSFQDKALANLMNVWTSRFPLDFLSLFNSPYESYILRYLGGEDDASTLVKMSFLHKKAQTAESEMKIIEAKIEVFFFHNYSENLTLI